MTERIQTHTPMPLGDRQRNPASCDRVSTPCWRGVGSGLNLDVRPQPPGLNEVGGKPATASLRQRLAAQRLRSVGRPGLTASGRVSRPRLRPVYMRAVDALGGARVPPLTQMSPLRQPRRHGASNSLASVVRLEASPVPLAPGQLHLIHASDKAGPDSFDRFTAVLAAVRHDPSMDRTTTSCWRIRWENLVRELIL